MCSLAIIPARKGSVRLPGKNTRLLGNKPMVQWTIEAALGSACVDEVLVTSDDEEVLGIAGKLGVPHLVNRPASLAGPDTSSADVVRHALAEADVRGIETTSICLLQPTSPLRTSAHIDEAFAMRAGPRAKPVVSVCELDHPLAWCFRLDDRQELHSLALPQVPLPYRLNGAIYIVDRDHFESCGQLVPQEALGYVMPRERSVDVDTQYDFDLAAVLIGRLQAG
ncbi:MAG TPA: acylneuraminate cytidylyltransferase family protein [Frateuria sp.]|uniref:acylneuraminate cytidylyltransferase family protein n=1 Tax=Frateuria sp. TaxID=2211372 RepID=UPI002D7F1E9F|nr:acylneuraminate cytidylyltransferase family protein [Frateuria sp.]HET6804145.1 acylneuraminate cytidylyltransferase family protein [Frateuria sp.]